MHVTRQQVKELNYSDNIFSEIERSIPRLKSGMLPKPELLFHGSAKMEKVS
jgi:hypothetical protein